MIATTPATTPPMKWYYRYPLRFADWTPEQRRQAALEGWRGRRDPARQARKRLDTLLRTTDACSLRLVACDVAEGVLPLYEATHPDDLRLRVALQVARRYARGEASERERMAAAYLAVAVLEGFGEHSYRCHHDPLYCVAEAVAFCLFRRVSTALTQAVDWTLRAQGAEEGLAHRLGLIAAIEARTARTTEGSIEP